MFLTRKWNSFASDLGVRCTPRYTVVQFAVRTLSLVLLALFYIKTVTHMRIRLLWKNCLRVVSRPIITKKFIISLACRCSFQSSQKMPQLCLVGRNRQSSSIRNNLLTASQTKQSERAHGSRDNESRIVFVEFVCSHELQRHAPI